MNNILNIILLTLISTLCSCSQKENAFEEKRQIISFNDNWKFHQGDFPDAMTPDFNDSDWRTLNLPHDWSIEGDFSKDHPAGTGGGALPGGIGWYRKTFEYDLAQNSKLFIDFDGVYMDSEVFLNGTSLGNRPNGYVSFRYDLTPYLNHNQKNVLAVRVNNNEQPNSRWYSGSGIYRNVRLNETSDIYVDLWGTYITTPEISKEKSLFSIITTVNNESNGEKEIELTSILLNQDNKEISRSSTYETLAENEKESFQHFISLNDPQLWSVDNPYLYKIRTEIRKDGILIDDYVTTTGIRSFDFDVKNGFFLNGQHLKINGVCMHQDLGCLGVAINERAIERQLEKLKEMGCNGIRTAHNPPSPELLNLCDKMGFIVMNETFDMWEKKKTKYDYSRFFKDWHEKDLNDIVTRDRNHPSIFMWCVGNEVLEQWSDANADALTLEEANLVLNFGHQNNQISSPKENLSSNALLCRKLVDMIKNLDSTRPVTAGCNEPDPENHLFKSGALDIIGFNYHDDYFSTVPEKFAGKPFIISESVSALMTRGYYQMPSDKKLLWPERWDKPFFNETFSCSSYDNCHTPWGNYHEGTLKHVKNNDFISGQYIWTGFDYLGEPTPFGWPARSSYFGIIDLAGFPKDIYYMYQSEWTDKDVLHLFPHWNWNAGQQIDMWAYYNNADEVELFINDKSQGIKRKDPDTYHVMWRVNYEPGNVKAISRKNGKVVSEKIINTAGEPYAIQLSADRSNLKNNGHDLSFVTVNIIDKNGNICPHADNLVNADISGAAFIAGVDNGNPVSLDSFKASAVKSFNGKSLIVLQNNGEKGKINLKVESGNLVPAQINLTANK